ncbi:hypothetical protein XENOCAPTIV_001733 [Xenoophorus captivus]|uniref:Uncharacterized protein n=1 Tax=Xenoophorus captivus TaxID=1517983 RepID=A0ABV0RX54_9TELE
MDFTSINSVHWCLSHMVIKNISKGAMCYNESGHTEMMCSVGRGWWVGPNAGHRPAKVKQSVLFREDKRSYTSMNDRYPNKLELTQELKEPKKPSTAKQLCNND